MSAVLIVAGHGRCGSSLVMQMLNAGGVPTIGAYPAYEAEESIPFNLTHAWLSRQCGRAIKVLDPQLAPMGVFSDIPRLVIWLDRNHNEQAKSHVKFGAACGIPFKPGEWRALAKNFVRDRRLAWMALEMTQCGHLVLTFEDLICRTPEAIEQIRAFIAPHFSMYPPAAAAVVVERGPACLPYLLEERLIARAQELNHG